MKLLKVTALVLVLSALFTLCACSEDRFYEERPFRGRHENSRAFMGELPEAKNDLPVISYEIKGRQCTYLDRTYTEFIREGAYVNWALDCRYLDAIGKTADGSTLYAIEEDDVPVVLLFVGTDIYNLWVGWYILEDKVDILDPYSYTFRDFDVTRVEGEEDPRFSDEDVWKYHISSAYTETGTWWFEVWEEHTLLMRSKTNQWLIYQLKYILLSAEGRVYVYNLPNDGMLMLTENGEYDAVANARERSKTADGSAP